MSTVYVNGMPMYPATAWGRPQPVMVNQPFYPTYMQMPGNVQIYPAYRPQVFIQSAYPPQQALNRQTIVPIQKTDIQEKIKTATDPEGAKKSWKWFGITAALGLASITLSTSIMSGMVKNVPVPISSKTESLGALALQIAAMFTLNKAEKLYHKSHPGTRKQRFMKGVIKLGLGLGSYFLWKSIAPKLAVNYNTKEFILNETTSTLKWATSYILSNIAWIVGFSGFDNLIESWGMKK